MLVLVVLRARIRARHQAVRAARPGWLLLEVTAGAGLGDALRTHGLWERRLLPGGGTTMTMAVSTAGLELWRGAGTPREVLSLPWSHVAALTPTTAQAGVRSRPAIEISTLTDAHLVLAPAARLGDTVLPAGPRDVEGHLTWLRRLRDGQAVDGPPVDRR